MYELVTAKVHYWVMT